MAKSGEKNDGVDERRIAQTNITMTLDSRKRSQSLSNMQNTPYDLLVIGGGITGAGIALDATTRGLKTALVEMQDFGAGTSSRSTKLIHGGLRYLKQFEIGLVREVGQERKILFRNAPHIVIPEKMLLPITKTGSLGKLGTAIGLWIYDLLVGVEKEERRKILSPLSTLKAEPLLNTEDLQGGGLYYEYRTDDARLTIEVIKTAVAHGADCLNYIKAVDFLHTGKRVSGVLVQDVLTGTEIELKAQTVVNATGPWVDTLRKQEGGLGKKKLHLTKGVHLVVPFTRLPIRQAAYFDAPDGRMIFAIPRDNITYIGTTDTNYTGPLDNPRTTQTDVDYILTAVNEMFPSVNLTSENVESTWSGIRPLIHEEGKSPSELSRKDEVFISDSGVVSIAGGKLTGFRKMAERAVDRAFKELIKVAPETVCQSSKTAEIPISGGVMPKGRTSFIQEWRELAKKEGWEEYTLDRLARYYGSNLPQIQALGTESGKVDWLLGEVRYAVQQEGVTGLSDLMIRRNGRLYFDRSTLPLRLESYTTVLARELGWSAEERAKQEADFNREYEEVVDFSG